MTDARRKWALALLFTTAVLNLLDRQIINVLAQSIKAELALSDTELGLITGTAFGAFYAVMTVVLGWLSDRVNRAKLLAAVIVVWSTFTIFCGFAGSFTLLFLGRMGLAVGQAAAQPASTALLADIFPAHRRASAMSVMLFGIPVGSFFGLLIGGAVADLWGWRTAFIIAGLPGFVLSLAVAMTVRDPRPAAQIPDAPPSLRSQGAAFFSTILMLAHRPGYVLLAVAVAMIGFLLFAIGAWLPLFFIRLHGMTIAEAGLAASLAVGIGGSLGTLGGGVLCDVLRPRVREPEIMMMMLIFGLAVPLLLTTVLASNRTLAVAAMFPLNAVIFAYLAPSTILIQRAATPETRSLGYAAISSLGSIWSLAIGLPMVGMISDALTPRLGVESIRYALAVCAVFGLVGLYCIWRTGRAFAADRRHT